MAEKKKDERMFQRLQLEVLDKDKRRKTVTFKVSGQSKRGEFFGAHVYDTGIGEYKGEYYTYRSSECPAWDDYDGTLYLLGTDYDKDSTPVKVKSSIWERVKKDVVRFNQQFRGSPVGIIDNVVEEAPAK